MKLDQASVGRLALPRDQTDLIVFDDKLPGFGVRVRGARKTWLVQYRVGRQQRRQTLGSVEAIPAGRAREAARDILAKVQLGDDPQANKAEKRARDAQTLGALGARFLEYQRTRLKARSFESIAAHVAKHLAPLMHLPAHSITRRDVAARLSEIAEQRGPYAANRARATLSSLFAWGMKDGHVEANPAADTNKATDEPARDRVLADAELTSIWNACGADDYGRIVRLLILTGQRRDEIGAAARSEVDFAARMLRLPRERTKNSRPHDVPLSDLALDIFTIAIQREGREEREFVFGDGAGPFSGWSSAKLALDTRIEKATKAALKPWRLHDLRRTAATGMAELGVQPHVVEAVLNHVSGHKAGAAGVYNRASYANEKCQGLDLWAAHVEALLAGRTASNIIKLMA